jgi:hypothetical protein
MTRMSPTTIGGVGIIYNPSIVAFAVVETACLPQEALASLRNSRGNYHSIRKSSVLSPCVYKPLTSALMSCVSMLIVVCTKVNQIGLTHESKVTPIF